MDDSSSRFIASNEITRQSNLCAPFPDGTYGLHLTRQENKSPFQFWPFVYLTVPQDAIGLPLNRIIGRVPAPEPIIAEGRRWIHDCINGHELCTKASSSPLPTRLIAVGDEFHEPCLELTEGQTGRYATLSYCWGGSQPLTLNSHTYDSFLKEMSFLSLPKTFQDAVTVTRQLGISYLWIDSICILQDSRDDWARECTRMEDTYRNSYINISAVAAPNPHTGFLLPRDKSSSMLVKVQWQLSDGKEQDVALHHVGAEESSFPRPERKSMLYKRGWVLQERILAPRILHFGSKKMYWECCTNVSYEDLHFPFVDNYQRRSEVQKFSFQAANSRKDWLRTWYQIVNTYSAKQLTYVTDRLPALSGVAREFSRVLQDNYVAGLWENDFFRGLCWYVPTHVPKVARHPPNGVYIAPSWSWAHLDCKTSFVNNGSTFHLASPPPKIVHWSAHPISVDRFGAVGDDAQLVIQGQHFKGKIFQRPGRFVPSTLEFYCLTNKGHHQLGEYHPDNLDWPDDESGDNISANTGYQAAQTGLQLDFLYLGTFAQGAEPRGGIVLGLEQISDNPALYRRHGLINGSYGVEPVVGPTIVRTFNIV